ncbi:acyltransferase [Tenacibaculum soleae]|uniref:acyltransferase n=1 Tax=Tenacibaculum soleae TaxID=447689 RepID=UPI003AB321D6
MIIILKFHKSRFRFLYPISYKKGSIHDPFLIMYPSKLHFGERFLLNDYLNVKNTIPLGNNVALSAEAKRIIGNNVQIGENATILADVTICDNVIIGAVAVVSKIILEYQI